MPKRTFSTLSDAPPPDIDVDASPTTTATSKPPSLRQPHPKRRRPISPPRTPSEPLTLLHLPVEILTEVFCHLDPYSSLLLSSTCRYFRDISTTHERYITYHSSFNPSTILSVLYAAVCGVADHACEGSVVGVISRGIYETRTGIDVGRLMRKSRVVGDGISELAGRIRGSPARPPWGGDEERLNMALVRLLALHTLARGSLIDKHPFPNGYYGYEPAPPSPFPKPILQFYVRNFLPRAGIEDKMDDVLSVTSCIEELMHHAVYFREEDRGIAACMVLLNRGSECALRHVKREACDDPGEDGFEGFEGLGECWGYLVRLLRLVLEIAGRMEDGGKGGKGGVGSPGEMEVEIV